MIWNILIVLGSLVVALVGIFSPKPGERTRMGLVLCAFIAALVGFVKAVADEKEKERLQESRSGPSPETMHYLTAGVDRFAGTSGYKRVGYYDGADGLSFFLDEGPQTGAIVLTKHDLVRVIENGSSEISNLISQQAADPYGLGSTTYDEDVYNRIAIVCAGAAQQRKQVSRHDWFKDADYGVRIDFYHFGKPTSILVTPAEIAAIPKQPRLRYFGRVLEICREKLA